MKGLLEVQKTGLQYKYLITNVECVYESHSIRSDQGQQLLIFYFEHCDVFLRNIGILKERENSNSLKFLK